MARDQEPLTDAELEVAQEAIREQRTDIREYLEEEGIDMSGSRDLPDDTISAERERADSD